MQKKLEKLMDIETPISLIQDHQPLHILFLKDLDLLLNSMEEHLIDLAILQMS